ncbi:MAG TPA: ATP-binding protein [Candidatus Methylomirabilis sp.]|nr:ATP-binding protein [Candidatus Methylomirabilis sp.]
MWGRWSLRTKIVLVTMGVVLPVIAATTALTVRMSRTALQDAIREDGLGLARELAASAAGQVFDRDPTLQQEINSLLGKGSAVRDAVVSRLEPHGLVVRAAGGTSPRPGPEDEIAAREDQEVVAVMRRDGDRVLRVAVPVRDQGRSVGVVSLGLPLDRADTLARREERPAVGLGLGSVILIVGGLSIFMNRALTAPVRSLVRVMQQAERGDLTARIPEDREDEVGQLSRGLNRMLEQVGSFQAELARQVSEATADLRTVNQRLFEAQHQIARNERLAAAGELAAAMAHDVGTPLTAVSGHLQLLAEAVAEPSLKERLGTIQAQVDRAVAAAKRFLDAARPEPARRPVDVNAVLEDLLVLVSPEVQRKGVAVRRDLTTGLVPVTGDPGQMQELFLNLITNALDVMGRGGTLTLATEATHSNGETPAIRVIVGDTGPGMTPEVLAHAFELFFTTRSASGGTGLGLAICRRIALDHGGTLRMESQTGQGTRAVIELPAATE